jgi:uncharacterized membrane protein YuzA (DUF378 family)
MMKCIGMVAWVVTALAAIAVGLMPFGYRFLAMSWFVENPMAATVVQYIVGILGVLSLVMFFASWFGGGCCCGNCHHGHKDHSHK